MQHDIDLDQVEPIVGAPALFERETGQSYLGRLAIYFRYSSIAKFCNDFDLDRRGVQWGHEAALRHLAALTAVDADALIQWTPTRIDRIHHRLGEVVFKTDLGPRSHVQQCPACAREEIAAHPEMPADLCLYGRAEWVTGYISACPIHEVMLVTHVADIDLIEHMDTAYVRTGIFEELGSIVDEPAVPTSFERHAMKVILGEQVYPSHFLATLTLDSLFRLSRALGADIVASSKLEGLEPRQVLAVGFDVIAGGPESLRHAFIEIRDRLPPRCKARNTVPHLLDCIWRARLEDLVRFRTLVAHLLMTVFPVKAGFMLLGVRCAERSLHTFNSGRRAYGITSDLFHAFIMGTPGLVIRSGKRPEILIDKAAADAFFIGLAPFADRLQLQDLLGRHHRGRLDHVEMLTDAGVLDGPLEHEALAGRDPTYSLPQVVRQLAAFVEPFRRVHAKPSELVSLRAANSRTKVPLAKLLELLVQRQLVKVAVLEGAAFMDSLFVDPEEILGVLAGIDRPMSKRAASAYLGVNGLALSSLIEQGWLIPGGTHQYGMLKDVFSKSQLDEFMARYARPREAYALTTARSATELRSKGLDPAILIDLESKGRGNFILYDRQEIAAFLERSTA